MRREYGVESLAIIWPLTDTKDTRDFYRVGYGGEPPHSAVLLCWSLLPLTLPWGASPSPTQREGLVNAYKLLVLLAARPSYYETTSNKYSQLAIAVDTLFGGARCLAGHMRGLVKGVMMCCFN